MASLDLLVSNGVVNFPPFAWNTRKGKNLHRFRIPFSRFCGTRFPPRSLSSDVGVSRICARFAQKSRRRSSLRKKLLDVQKHRRSSNSFDPSMDSRNLHPSVEGSGELSTFMATESGLGRDSNILNELENWVSKLKEETEYWGIGSNPIFTVFQDLDGEVEKVRVDEDEILRRSKKSEDMDQANAKVLYARNLAQEMEKGNNVISRNSSVAKFVDSREESGFKQTKMDVILRPNFVPKLKVLGRAVFCGFVVFSVFRTLSDYWKKEFKLTRMEKEMMRRKVKARKDREMLSKGSVEVVALATPTVPFERPKLDQQELMKSISKAKASNVTLEFPDTSMASTHGCVDVSNEIQEIREMAKHARAIEDHQQSEAIHDEKQTQVVDNGTDQREMEQKLDIMDSVSAGNSGKGDHNDGHKSIGLVRQDLKEPKSMSQAAVNGHVSDIDNRKVGTQTSGYLQRGPRIITSVKEAREFLSRKHSSKGTDDRFLRKTDPENGNVSKLQRDELSNRYAHTERKETFKGLSQPMFDLNSYGNSSLENSAPLLNKVKDQREIKARDARDASWKHWVEEDTKSLPSKEDSSKVFYEEYETNVDAKPTTSSDSVYKEKKNKVMRDDNWEEKNFNEFEQVVKRIGTGFKENYMVAREKVSGGESTSSDISQLKLLEDRTEYEWMRDDKLRELVFRVRDNELAGRDPFHQLDQDDKVAFFQGLEQIAEKENQKLSHLHEWLHSNIENLDYGADGISIYDPPEKIIPRWKGPSLEKNPAVLSNYFEQRKALYPEKLSTSFLIEKNEKLPANKNASSSLNDNSRKDVKNCRTVIEASDGTAKPGKKSGKEFWQHTKKWSEGFLKSYNEETDPEIKAVMKDIGKDLDRWITEKEIQEAGELMSRQHERNKEFMEKKLNKLRREMELFGPQAVVSKYREYADDKEEDYLWWLDLPHVLFIELYTVDDGDHRVGFYALEMASDLDLEPKPHHVIAFENAADCKKFCCIIQTHLEMLGNGNAFIVPLPPKEAFREAKANGFGVTVIKKGELQLNIDQTLEEVEEEICEIGSKFYHDRIMRERSVDISSLMKGVFGLNSKKPGRKSSKRLLQRLKKKHESR